MTKADIVDSVYDQLGDVTKREAAVLVDEVFGAMIGVLALGGSVKISGFGRFRVRSKAARQGRNPHTGATIALAARRVVKFYPSPVLGDLLNGRR